MSVLIIGPNEERSIQDAVAKARAKPTPWEVLQAVADGSSTPTLMLKDRKPGVDALREQYPPQNVMLGTYRAAISFEHQPAGLIRHLSVSSHTKGKVPGPEVMKMVCEAFGFNKQLCEALLNRDAGPMSVPSRIWVEEYEPGHMAVNVVEVEQ